jgi:AbrB family looped-hinge helix DNA binding protein
VASTVGSKGQVVIEKGIRDALGIEAGYIAVQRKVGDRVELRFFPPEHSRSLRGLLRRQIGAHVDRDQWEAAREEAWRRAAVEEEGAPDDPDEAQP